MEDPVDQTFASEVNSDEVGTKVHYLAREVRGTFQDWDYVLLHAPSGVMRDETIEGLAKKVVSADEFYDEGCVDPDYVTLRFVSTLPRPVLSASLEGISLLPVDDKELELFVGICRSLKCSEGAR